MEDLRKITSLISTLHMMRVLRTRDSWSRDTLNKHQERSLAALRQFAYHHSPFYRELHRGFEDAPLKELPIVTKTMMMDRFDDFVTDRNIRISDMRRHVEAGCPGRWKGVYEDVLMLSGIRIHPNVFHDVMDTVPNKGWQVVQEENGLRILLIEPQGENALLQKRLADALHQKGAGEVSIRIDVVEAIPKAKSGKTPLIRAHRNMSA